MSCLHDVNSYPKIKMNKCAIIGGSGFIGKNLLGYLDHLQMDCTSIPRADLFDIKTIDFDAYETVIDLAGLAHDISNCQDDEPYYRANFELTKKLYDRFLTSNATKFIFISSVKASADEVDGVLTESMMPSPKTVYGKTKLMAEQYITRQELPQEKQYYILRPCMTHGQGNKGNLNLLYKIIENGVPYFLAGFNNKRSFLSVENLCFIIHELIVRNDIKSDVYNVADDIALSTNQVVSILASSLHRKPRLWKVAPKIIYLLAGLGDLLHLPFTTERLTKLTENYVVSNAKIKAAIKKSLPLSAVDGLIITATSFSKTNK